MQTEESIATVPAENTVQPHGWRDMLRPWWHATLSVLPIFLLTRFIFLLFGYLGSVLFVSNVAGTTPSLHDLLANWNRGDVTNILTIAASGYTQTEQTPLFPLFPTLIRAIAPLFHGSQLLAGFLLANAAFAGILILLYMLVKSEFDRRTAKRSVLYLAIFPTAFVFFIGYNEALFVFLALLSFYSMRRGSWWLAGLFGALATLTQFAGIFLFVIFLCEYARQEGSTIRNGWKSEPFPRRLYPTVPLLAALCMPLALGLYCIALQAIFKDPFAFLHAQSEAGFSALRVALVTLKDQPHFSVVVVHTLWELCTFLIFIVLLALCCFGPERLTKNQWTYVLFGALLLFSALFFPGNVLSTTGLNEPLALLPRFVLSIFPCFILLARLGRRAWFHQAYLLLSLPLLGLLLLQFIMGQWLP